MVPKGITEGYDFRWNSRSLWPKREEYPKGTSYESIRPTEDKRPDIITLYEEKGIWASRKLQAKEITHEKASPFTRFPFWYNGSGITYSLTPSKGVAIDLFA